MISNGFHGEQSGLLSGKWTVDILADGRYSGFIRKNTGI